MSAPESPILRFLTSVSDGAEIDWENAEHACRDDDERRFLASLRVVAGVSEFHGRPADSTGALQPGDRLGHLAIRELAGAGAWGEVYRAEDTRLRRAVAVKIVGASPVTPPAAAEPARGESQTARGESLAGYLEEARRLASIRHPNVVTVHSVETMADAGGTMRTAIVMEYIPGRPLAEIIRLDGPRGAAEVIAIGVELCRALAAVHGAGLVHRDVKAQNVMRETGGRIVLMDFGPAGATPLYMAPELFRGSPPSQRSDIYALGVLLYHLATGAFPVSGDDLDQLREAHVRGRRIPLRDVRPDLPADLVREIERALAPDPADRHASAGEMERTLASCLHDPAASAASFGAASFDAASFGAATAAGGTAALPNLTHRPGRKVLATGVVAAALLIAAVLLLSRGEREPGVTQGEELAGSSGESAPLLSYTIEAGVWNGRGQRSSLREGSRVSPGDSISLSLRASRDLYVYVINEDESGEAYLLFPSPDFDGSNPLAAGPRHLLPGTREGREVYWQVTSPGGRERLLFVASPRRLPALEEDASSLPRPAKDHPVRYARLKADEVTQTLRGLGGWVEGPGTGSAPRARGLFELAERLIDGREDVRGVWIRRLDLSNPGRTSASGGTVSD